MAHTMQTELVREIADLVQDYRDGNPALVKFGMKCAITLDKLPIGAGIIYSPKAKSEMFPIKDTTFRKDYETDKDAFFAAFDRFVANAEFVAWNGKMPEEGASAVAKTLSDDNKYPTMQAEVIYRKRGGESEMKLKMLFVGFNNEKEAASFAEGHEEYLV